jgi:serine/threonine protein kinase, bacterial
VLRSSLRAGKMLRAGYQLKQFRGQGSFGHVWETQSPQGEKLALKFLRCGSDMAAAQEVRNILSVRQLSHPHLIRIDRVWADRGYLVVVMELADGSLHDLLNVCRNDYGTPVPPDYLCHYLTQAAKVIDFLNARQHRLGGNLVGVQHCDIKPSNLLLCGETVKLCDFSLASPISASMVQHRRAGTLAYAAPEVFQGLLSQWTDQFALAVTYCELRGGRRPFPAPQRFTPDFVLPDPDLTMLPEAERSIVARALALSPSARWKNCSEMMAQLAPHIGA